MHKDVEIVIAHLKTLGIDVRVGSFDQSMRSPFSTEIGLDYERKILYFAEEKADRGVMGLVHEAAHMVACLEPPTDSDETRFLGWELALAKELGVAHYWIGALKTFGSMTDDEILEYFDEQISAARSIGIVVEDTAIAIR
jgi:hypothetical protein